MSLFLALLVLLSLLSVTVLYFLLRSSESPEVEAPRESDPDWAWPPRKTLP